MPKKIYDWSTYKWTKLNSEGDIDSLIRYNFNKAYGVVDSLSNLLPEDDAATVNFGKDWRMPTKEEIVELYENCKYCWTEINGVSGAKFTSSNGNSIFFLRLAPKSRLSTMKVMLDIIGHHLSTAILLHMFCTSISILKKQQLEK